MEQSTDDSFCSQCSKTFANRSNLQKHINRIHKRIIKAECEICEEKFFSSDELKFHKKKHYEKEKKLKLKVVKKKLKHCCDICDKTFASVTNLNYHFI